MWKRILNQSKICLPVNCLFSRCCWTEIIYLFILIIYLFVFSFCWNVAVFFCSCCLYLLLSPPVRSAPYTHWPQFVCFFVFVHLYIKLFCLLYFLYLFIASGRPLIVLIDHLRSRRCVPFKLSRLDLHVSSTSLENITYSWMPLPDIILRISRIDVILNLLWFRHQFSFRYIFRRSTFNSHNRELCWSRVDSFLGLLGKLKMWV